MSDHSEESSAVARGLGKWGQKGVPHKGWTCIDNDELAKDERQTCQMCETMQIRFIHVMQHPDYAGPLECGCICAGRMEENLNAAKDRERVFKNSRKRRAAFPHARGWHTSRKGNQWINHRGYRITIVGAPGRYQVIAVPPVGEPVHMRQRYPTIEAAQIAAYDYVARKLARVGLKL